MAASTNSADVSARIVNYPSAALPGVPPFVAVAPDGWISASSPSSLVVIHEPEAVEGYFANAVIEHTRVARSVDFKRASQVTWAKVQREAPDVKARFERMAQFGNNRVYLRGAEMTAPANKRAFSQLHSLSFAPAADDAKLVDLFQITCTVPSNRIDAVGPLFMEIISSFRFA